MTAMTPKQLLAATCPHGNALGKCGELWCQSRAEDLLHGEYDSKMPELPEVETTDAEPSRAIARPGRAPA